MVLQRIIKFRKKWKKLRSFKRGRRKKRWEVGRREILRIIATNFIESVKKKNQLD